MKQDYEFWSRIVKEFEDAIDKAESELAVNSIILEAALEERKKYPKPKKDPNPITT